MSRNSANDINVVDSSDDELRIAARDYALRMESIQSEAYRQVLSEVGGEIYTAAYLQTYTSTLKERQRQWGKE
ncbi:hypothetical protein ERJ75_000988900 [Trypanosoma vivax]|nr:hypothetical protein ERJ75_000988900 [Trypanosoma vivax]